MLTAFSPARPTARRGGCAGFDSIRARACERSRRDGSSARWLEPVRECLAPGERARGVRCILDVVRETRQQASCAGFEVEISCV